MTKTNNFCFYFFVSIFALFKILDGFPVKENFINIVPVNLDGYCPKIEWMGLDAGVIYSPNFPDDYTDDVNCTYLITCPTGTTVNIIFEVIKLDSCCDHVFLYEGATTNSENLIATVGSETTQLNYSTTSSNIMTVQFISDDIFIDQGFYAVFSTTNNSPVAPISSNSYLDPFGVIVSPNFPANYPPDSNVTYLLGSGDEGTIVALQINSFITEGCCDDLKIYNGQDSSSGVYQRLFCTIDSGTMFYSSTPYMYLVFTSDSITEKAGYSITYKIVDANVLSSVATGAKA